MTVHTCEVIAFCCFIAAGAVSLLARTWVERIPVTLALLAAGLAFVAAPLVFQLK